MLLRLLAFLCGPALPVAQAALAYDEAFERDLFKRRFEHEVKFRASAIQLAWGAQVL